MSEVVLGFPEESPPKGLSTEDDDNLARSNKKAKMLFTENHSQSVELVLETPMEKKDESDDVESIMEDAKEREETDKMKEVPKGELFENATGYALRRNVVSYKDAFWE
ncbi:ABC transporter substrate-binding protein [Sesbania bispinosa]|nr:ABC transporter substrate-binding protein [Sesbania bispinosa]